IPDSLKSLLPSPEIPVNDFIVLNLPEQSESLVSYPAPKWFCSEAPSSTLDGALIFDIVSKKSIPPTNTLTTLRDAIGQEWLDGAKLVIDPRFKSRRPLPLWVVTLWRMLADIKDKQETWKDAQHFVAMEVSKRNVHPHYPTVESVLGDVPWNGEVQSGTFMFPTHRFSQLLRPDQLCDDITQAMTAVLQEQCKGDDGSHRGNMIAASRFYSAIQVAVERNRLGDGKKLPQLLKAVEDATSRNPKLKLWFPVLYRSHEIVVCVDFGKNVVIYGDSIAVMPPPTLVMNTIQKWLKARYKKTFGFEGNQLPHGDQEDAISCIPCTVNTISHGVFGDQIWTHELRFVDRFRWFRRLVHGGDVPNPPNISLSNSQPNVVRPSLTNLLNPTEEVVFQDLIEFLEMEIRDENDTRGGASGEGGDGRKTKKD
ncbi:hypothetical protein V5O48_019160, partial [Marasmius crinis-equi]